MQPKTLLELSPKMGLANMNFRPMSIEKRLGLRKVFTIATSPFVAIYCPLTPRRCRIAVLSMHGGYWQTSAQAWPILRIYCIPGRFLGLTCEDFYSQDRGTRVEDL